MTFPVTLATGAFMSPSPGRPALVPHTSRPEAWRPARFRWSPHYRRSGSYFTQEHVLACVSDPLRHSQPCVPVGSPRMDPAARTPGPREIPILSGSYLMGATPEARPVVVGADLRWREGASYASGDISFHDHLQENQRGVDSPGWCIWNQHRPGHVPDESKDDAGQGSGACWAYSYNNYTRKVSALRDGQWVPIGQVYNDAGDLKMFEGKDWLP
jgi:hypothetical protein